MFKSFRGKFGRNAGKEFARKIHRARLSGDLKITPKMEKQINERFIKVFAKNGKVPLGVKERDIEKEVLNPLRHGLNDYFSSKNIDAVDKGFGFTDHTKQIGNKYSYVLQQEKKAKTQERREVLKVEKENMAELKKKQKEPEVEKLRETPRYDELRIKIADEALKRKEAMSNRFSGKKQELDKAAHNKFENDRNLGGIKSNREAPNSMPDRGIPHEAHGGENPISHTELHTEPLKLPSEFSK